jgi:hypothetical protein
LLNDDVLELIEFMNVIVNDDEYLDDDTYHDQIINVILLVMLHDEEHEHDEIDATLLCHQLEVVAIDEIDDVEYVDIDDEVVDLLIYDEDVELIDELIE